MTIAKNRVRWRADDLDALCSFVALLPDDARRHEFCCLVSEAAAAYQRKVPLKGRLRLLQNVVSESRAIADQIHTSDLAPEFPKRPIALQWLFAYQEHLWRLREDPDKASVRDRVSHLLHNVSELIRDEPIWRAIEDSLEKLWLLKGVRSGSGGHLTELADICEDARQHLRRPGRGRPPNDHTLTACIFWLAQAWMTLERAPGTSSVVDGSRGGRFVNFVREALRHFDPHAPVRTALGQTVADALRDLKQDASI